MPQPIKVRGRFATARDTAATLGVSASRTRELIEAVKKFTERVVYRDSEHGSFAAHKKSKTVSPVTAVRRKKSSGRHAESSKKKAHTNSAKSHR
jgi:hypothetical protein